MRVFLIACLAAIVLAVGGLVGLASVQKAAGMAYVGDGARVNPKWSWRSLVSKAKPIPATSAIAAAQPGDAMADDCGVSSTWAMILADFTSTPTADPPCEH